ncbi:MAG: hypothetical protein MUO21_02345 [Nitrososphaeraceae archaeon]|nr:hypothetical protein [Nitrososphaeraceae archaeon]
MSSISTCQCPCQSCRTFNCGRCNRCPCGFRGRRGCGFRRRRGCGRCNLCRSGRSESCPVSGVTNLHAMEYFNDTSASTFNIIMLILILIVVLYIAMKHYKE